MKTSSDAGQACWWYLWTSYTAAGDQEGRRMNPKKQLLKYIQNAYADTNRSGDDEKRGTSGNNDSRNEVFQELFDGMSSGTARIVIEQDSTPGIRLGLRDDNCTGIFGLCVL